VYIFYADSPKTSSEAVLAALKGAPGTPTVYKPGGRSGPRIHPDRSVIAALAKTCPWLTDENGNLPANYGVAFISNSGHAQWEASPGYSPRGEAWGYMDSNFQWMYHEYIGHGFTGLADEYSGAASGAWSDNGNVNVSGQGFPAYGTARSVPGTHGEPNPGSDDYGDSTTNLSNPAMYGYRINEVNWPDVPGGPMAWADAIFGDEKGDGFWDVYGTPAPDGAKSAGWNNVPDFRGYFINNSKWTSSLNPDYRWPEIWQIKSSNWTREKLTSNEKGMINKDNASWTNWKTWPAWVVFIGRKGYTRFDWDQYAQNHGWGGWKTSPWINGMGGADHSFNGDDGCTMRQTSYHFCAICRYRIWTKIQNLAYGRSNDELYIENKFPSEAGLREFVPFDKSTNYGRYDRNNRLETDSTNDGTNWTDPSGGD
jgi:hypothetical protein